MPMPSTNSEIGVIVEDICGEVHARALRLTIVAGAAADAPYTQTKTELPVTPEGSCRTASTLLEPPSVGPFTSEACDMIGVSAGR